MKNSLSTITNVLISELHYEVSNYREEPESREYEACRFELNGKRIICRTAKITPTKAGQFVTFWKRNGKGPIEPFEETDPFDLFLVIAENESRFGFFAFPKSELIKRGIISTLTKEGKRAFRVYPPWDAVKSKQALQTQKWQANHFFTIAELDSLSRIKALFIKSE